MQNACQISEMWAPDMCWGYQGNGWYVILVLDLLQYTVHYILEKKIMKLILTVW